MAALVLLLGLAASVELILAFVKGYLVDALHLAIVAHFIDLKDCLDYGR